MLLEPDKAQLVVMTIVCLQNFLRRSFDSTAIYTPSCTLNFEENGRGIEGSWRVMSNENMTSFFPNRKSSVNHV